MSNVKVMKSITPENRPSFNDWCQEFNVSSSYVEPELRDNFKLTKPLKPKEESFWERLFRSFGL
jgi:hypothetical protein